MVTIRKGSCKGLNIDVLHLRVLRIQPWRVWNNWSHSLWKQNLISAGAFLYKDLGLRTDWIALKEKDPLSIMPWNINQVISSVFGHFHCFTGETLDLQQSKNKSYQAGEMTTTSSFSETWPILQQITGFVVSIKATSRHPSSCMIWPWDTAYICMPSRDSCQCLMSGCLLLSRLKPIRTSSSKISV